MCAGAAGGGERYPRGWLSAGEYRGAGLRESMPVRLAARAKEIPGVSFSRGMLDSGGCFWAWCCSFMFLLRVREGIFAGLNVVFRIFQSVAELVDFIEFSKCFF